MKSLPIHAFVNATFIALLSACAGTVFAQNAGSPSDAIGSTDSAPLASGAPVPTSVDVSLAPRQLAEGVLTVIPPGQSKGDTSVGPIDLSYVAEHPELAWGPPEFPEGTPNFMSKSETLMSMGRDISLRHPVWALEFAFKPLRLIETPVVTAGGVTENQIVWYLLYRVRYVGGDLMPNLESVEAGTGLPADPKTVIYKDVRFLPRFTLIAPEINAKYDSQIISTAKAAIANRERVGKPIYDYMEMASRAIKPTTDEADNSVWGIATWAGIDPRIDALYVDIRGLTNAYQLNIDADGSAKYARKTLRLYFWKPGDSIDQEADRVQLGLPAFEDKQRMQEALNLFRIKEPLDYSWIYR